MSSMERVLSLWTDCYTNAQPIATQNPRNPNHQICQPSSPELAPKASQTEAPSTSGGPRHHHHCQHPRAQPVSKLNLRNPNPRSASSPPQCHLTSTVTLTAAIDCSPQLETSPHAVSHR
ncbi:hypothetical protein SLA2020_367180 [Shorea laevis]